MVEVAPEEAEKMKVYLGLYTRQLGEMSLEGQDPLYEQQMREENLLNQQQEEEEEEEE